MIIGANRKQVIKNIKEAVACGSWNAKVEIGDPSLSLSERKKLVDDFWHAQSTALGWLNNHIGHLLFNLLAYFFTRGCKFEGLENLRALPHEGAIITANHFNQFDSLPIKRLARKTHRRLSITIEDTNLKLPGILRYIMNYVGTIPLVQSPSYIGHEFPQHLHDALDGNNWVLIFPEEEMWWNYRKPRKPQRGAYYFAAKQNVPIISTFIEIQPTNKLEHGHPDFYQTRYVVHVLPLIWPDPQLSVKENSKRMMVQDYQQKAASYEQAYRRKLDYDFTAWDIAGWRIDY